MKKIFILLALVLISCTANERARQFGGDEIINLDSNEVLLNVSWKGNDLWMFIEDTAKKTRYYKQHSPYGVIEGKITFQ